MIYVIDKKGEADIALVLALSLVFGNFFILCFTLSLFSFAALLQKDDSPQSSIMV
ncbi:MAG: hypothetical protein VX730_07630 [Pseudomonadota bacterium]|nr:hypothetical protein [Pseudomonadota bacterium]